MSSSQRKVPDNSNAGHQVRAGADFGIPLVPHPASPLLLRHLPRLLPHLLTPPISPTGSELRSQGPEPLPQQQPQSPDPKPKPNERGVSACGTPAPTPCSPLPTSISLRSSPSSHLGPSHVPVGVRITHTRVCANYLIGQDYISHEALLWESRLDEAPWRGACWDL